MSVPTSTCYDTSDALFSQLAAERALYMTPPVHSAAYSTFPLSPLSDPCSTPDLSYSSSGWEPKQTNTVPSPKNNQQMYSISSTQSTHALSPNKTQEDDWFTPLEMPDGSTRMTSNWLPVDSTAGFTIGSHGHHSACDAEFPSVDGFQDIQNAFITLKPVDAT